MQKHPMGWVCAPHISPLEHVFPALELKSAYHLASASQPNAPGVHILSTSTVFLPEDSRLRRLPRSPDRKRPDHFYEAFEDRALFYDCFEGLDGEIVLIGPPPCNLMPAMHAASFRVSSSGQRLDPVWYPSRSTMTTVLSGAPRGTQQISFEMDGISTEITVQPSRAELLAGRRVMFTMNKNNNLEWIELWAQWHATLHGVDAVIIFDNGSTRYHPDDLARTLARVEGLRTIGIVSWPFRYGPVDPAVLSHPYWPNFLQVASFTLMLRRLGRESVGLLNCDIDELVGLNGEHDVFMSLAASAQGYVKLSGTWIEAVVARPGASCDEPLTHLDFRYRRRNPVFAKCANKWVIDPGRTWAKDFAIFPMMHRIYGLSRREVAGAPRHSFWHFRGINTNWKEQRAANLEKPAHWWRHVEDRNWLSHCQYFAEKRSRI